MGDIEIEIDVKKEDLVGPALREGLSEGLKDTGNTLLRRGQEKAEDSVAGVRVWRGSVLEAFEHEAHRFPRQHHWKGWIRNTAPHAKIVDEGLAPAGEHGPANPSVQDILPWVSTNLLPVDLRPDDREGGGGGMTLSDLRAGPDGGITDPDATVGNYRTTEDLGIPKSSFQSEYPRAANMENGELVIWKSHDDDNISDKMDGSIRNEAVWSEAQQALDEDLGPNSRIDTTTIDGVEVTGTAQSFVEGQRAGAKYDFTGNFQHDKEDFDRFVRNHRDWFAKVGALDYIVGNTDRHKANVRFDEAGNPQAIDNGGKYFRDDLNKIPLELLPHQSDYAYVNNPDKLHTENMKMFDQMEQELKKLANDEEFRQALIEKARQVHGPDNRWTKRLEKVIGEDITSDHILHEDSNGVPLWKRHLEAARQKYKDKKNSALDPADDADPDDGLGDKVENSKSANLNLGIDDMMDHLTGSEDP